MEFALRRSFEASLLALRAHAVNSLMARAMKLWLDDLASSDELSRATKHTLKKIFMAAAFAANSSLDALQCSASALATNAMRNMRNIWLRYLFPDQGSKARLAAAPFVDSRLFGPVLDPHLLENEEGCKVLSSYHRDVGRARRAFRDHHPYFRQEDSSFYSSSEVDQD